MKTPIYPNQGTQEAMVLKALLDADGGWVSKRVFAYSMHLTQGGRAIWNLQNKFMWNVEASDFRCVHGFKSYRVLDRVQVPLF